MTYSSSVRCLAGLVRQEKPPQLAARYAKTARTSKAADRKRTRRRSKKTATGSNMLARLRKASESFIGRAVMALVLVVIVFSFVIWGIGDIFQGFTSDRIAQVGDRKITVQEFKTAYLRELNQLQQQQQRMITSQEAQAMGLDGQVLAGLVADASFDVQAQRLGLAASDAQVRDSIVNDASLKGPDGKFDPNAFNNLLSQAGLSEAQFTSQQRLLMMRRQIADALLSNFRAPLRMQEAVDQFRNETRSVDMFVLPSSAAGTIADPSDKDLEAWFEERKSQWSAPEYRSLVILSLEPSDLSDPSKISDDAARTFYDANKASMGTPEKRAIQQATFPTREAAEAAAADLKSSKDFAAATAAQKGSLTDLGVVDRSAVFDPAAADAAFSTAAGQTSAPVQGRFGWLILRVSAVTPATIPSFDQIKADIKAKLAAQAGAERVTKLRDQIEDQRTAGKSLTEAATSLGLSVRKVDAVDAKGEGRDGKALNLPDQDGLLKAAFGSDVGMDNDVLSTKDGGDVWFEVASIDPAHQRSFAEAKTAVLASWRADETARRLADKARDIVKQLDSGASLAAIAKTFGAPVKSATDLKRLGGQDVAPQIIAAAFVTPVHGSGSAAVDPQSRTIFQVNDSQTPPFDATSETAKNVADDLKQQMSGDMLAEYLQAMQSDLGVTVDQAGVAAAVSGTSQQP